MKTLSKIKIYSPFTLIELMAAMGVFAIIMFIVMSFFSAANKAWTNCRERSEVYENARVAMDLMSRDIQCIYYEYEKIPFYHSSTSGPNDNEALFFVSATSIGSTTSYSSKICEIAYSFYNQDMTGCKSGWLVRSATADNNPTKWNYYNRTSSIVYPPSGNVYDASNASFAFTKDNNSKEGYTPVVPNVVKLSFVCLKADGSLIDPSTTPNMFPYSIIANLTLLDSNSWAKWLAQGGKPDDPDNDSASAKTFREQNERKFSKTIIIGERGQQY